MFFALPIALILSGLSLLHLYWTAGGKWGGDDAIPSLPVAMTATEPGCTRDEPEMVKALTHGKATTLSVAGALALVALLVVLHAGLLGPAVSHWPIAIIAGCGCIRHAGESSRRVPLDGLD